MKMKGRIKALLFLFLIFLVSASPVLADWRFEYYNTDDSHAQIIYGIYWWGQTFTTTISHNVSYLKLRMYRTNEPGTLEVSIRATSGGLPTGSDLTYGSINASTFTTSSAGEWYRINVTDYRLDKNTMYAIVCRARAGSPNYQVHWRVDMNDGAYPGGTDFRSEDDGASFEFFLEGTSDFMFEVWGAGSSAVLISADLEDVDDDGADWVFTNWKYYFFNLTVIDTGYDNVSFRFTIPTSFEDVSCVFWSDGSDWVYSSNMSYESRYGEPVLLRAGTWSEDNNQTEVTFYIWFQEHVLDVWDPGDAIPVDASVDGGSWVLAHPGLFRIYSKGGFSLNTESTNSSWAYILDGGTPFSFHVADDGGVENQWMYNEIWFRDVQHLKLLPEIHFLTGEDAFEVRYGCDYSFGDGTWETGWYLDVKPETVHYNGYLGAAVWINMTVQFKDRFGTVSIEDLYMYHHGSITGVGAPGWWEMWIDLWVSDKNASSVGAGRVNAYEYAMEDEAALWIRWLNNNWAPMDDVFKEFQGEVPILGDDNATIKSSQSVVMWRYWSRVKVFSQGYGQVIEVRNFEHFDATRSQVLPLTGISSPVFDETIIPVVGSKGLMGALYTMFSSIGAFLSENVLFGGLNLWGSFVNFLDSIAGLFGQPRFFTNLFNWIGQMFGYIADGISYVATLLISLFLLFASLMGVFLTQMANLISSIVATLDYFGDMMGGAYGVGVNVWNDLGISTWILLLMVFYPIYLIILWDEEGMDPVIKQLTWMFGLLSWIFHFFIALGQFIIRLIVTVIESIPIVE